MTTFDWFVVRFRRYQVMPNLGGRWGWGVKLVNPISTKGVDYAHLLLTSTATHPPYFQTFRHSWYQCSTMKWRDNFVSIFYLYENTDYRRPVRAFFQHIPNVLAESADCGVFSVAFSAQTLFCINHLFKNSKRISGMYWVMILGGDNLDSRHHVSVVRVWRHHLF